MLQFTNFTYYKYESRTTRYHQENYWNVTMEISKFMANQNYTEHAARKQDFVLFVIVIDTVFQASAPH